MEAKQYNTLSAGAKKKNKNNTNVKIFSYISYIVLYSQRNNCFETIHTNKTTKYHTDKPNHTKRIYQKIFRRSQLNGVAG